MSTIQTNALQFYHVSQLYEMVTFFAIFILFVIECAAICTGILNEIYDRKFKDFLIQRSWVKKQGGDDESELQVHQKAVVDQVRNQITQMQKKAQDQSEQHHEQKMEVAPQTQRPAIHAAELEKDHQQQKQQQTNPASYLSQKQQAFANFYMQYQKIMSQHTPIILSILIVGILTRSTYVFSLACYFCYLFCNMLFDFLHLEQRLKEEYSKGIIIGRLVKLLSCIFAALVLLGYWTTVQFK